LTAAKLCNAELKGATLGSRDLWFTPNRIQGGKIVAEIGTAGSIPMLLLTVLPIGAYASDTVRIHVAKGGTDVRFAPTINYLKYVLLPTLSQMGLETSLTIKKYGYYPKGNGEVLLEIHPTSKLSSLCQENFGTLRTIQGTSVCTFLERQQVAERQAAAASKSLRSHGYKTNIQVINDRSNPTQKGSSIVLCAETTTGVLLGGDAIGERRKSSERVGYEAAARLLTETQAHTTVDTHLADILIPYIALAKGHSVYLTHTITDHLSANIWLVQEILDVRVETVKCGHLFRIETPNS
jgi:RNA 3'-phosphate cyclase